MIFRNLTMTALLIIGMLFGPLFHNPVCSMSLPDPTVINVDGTFWLYATEATRNVPIMKSVNLLDWNLEGTVFTERTRPGFVERGGIWSPDINRIGDKYVLYYSMSVWNGINTCGIGVAVSRSPEGPWKDCGKLLDSASTGVKNSIDPFHIEDAGRHYLVWGVNYGIWCIELSSDGLSVKKGAKPVKLAGDLFGAPTIHKRAGSYYLIMSAGTYGSAKRSQGRIVVAKAESLTGPYLDRNGRSAVDGNAEDLISSSTEFVGVSHNSRLLADRNGDDWIMYHAYWSRHEDSGRMLMLDKIQWKNGWPTVEGGIPSTASRLPEF
ncbi:MAG: family 43 glycosylhydrolase [Candidatus Cryptobacteroides sp.]